MLGELTGDERFQKAIELASDNPDIIIVDVRTPDEYAVGHIPGSINIPVEKLSVTDIDSNVHILAYCMSGSRSERAVAWLKERDFDAENIGGIMWYDGETLK